MRRLAILFSLIAAGLFALNAYNRPNPAISLCLDNSPSPDQIIAACTELIDDSTAQSLPTLLINRSWAFRRLGNFDRALSDLDHALRIDPRFINAWINKAYIHVAAGNPDAAEADFKAALMIAPDSIWVIMHRAKLNFRSDNYDLARQDYEWVLELDPLNYKAAMNIAFSHMNQVAFDQAIKWLEGIAIFLPDEPRVFIVLGSLNLLHAKDFDYSWMAFTRLEALRPGAALNQLWLGATQLWLGDKALGVAHIEQFAVLTEAEGLASEGEIYNMFVYYGQRALSEDAMQWLIRGIAYAGLDHPTLAQVEFEHIVTDGGVVGRGT